MVNFDALVGVPHVLIQRSITSFGLFVALCISQTGSLFSADAWNSVATIAGEIKEPRRNVPLALGLGTGLVIALYLLANVQMKALHLLRALVMDLPGGQPGFVRMYERRKSSRIDFFTPFSPHTFAIGCPTR